MLQSLGLAGLYTIRQKAGQWGRLVNLELGNATVIAERDDIRPTHDKRWDEMPRLEGQGACEDPQPWPRNVLASLEDT